MGEVIGGAGSESHQSFGGSATEPIAPVVPESTPEEVTSAQVTEIAAEADAAAQAEAEGVAPIEGNAADAAAQEEGSTETPDANAEVDVSKPEEALAAAAGFSIADITKEFTDTQGKMTPETTAKLAGVLENIDGFDSETAQGLVESFFEGRRSQVAVASADLMSVVGGDAGYKAISEWATANMSHDERVAHDRVVANATAQNDAEGVKDALRSLKAKYEQHVGTNHVTIDGDNNPPQVARPITSMRELARIQGTPEYDQDPHFRAAVGRRVQAAKDRGNFQY